MSFDLILPFLSPIRHLILDPDISEIMLNGGDTIFVERDGRIEPVPNVRVSAPHLLAAARLMARACHDELSDERPILDARLPDGSRVAVLTPPASRVVVMTIRKFGARRFTLDDLGRVGMLPEALLPDMRAAIADRRNILISGGTGTGKTTVLAALAEAFDPHDRIILIEDTAEIALHNKTNLVCLQAQRDPRITIRDLVRASLRHRPDRLLIGEVRGGEAWDLLQCWNTGHAGSLCTIHADSARLAIVRLASCVLQAQESLPYEAICTQIANRLHLILHLERVGPRRVATEWVRLTGYDTRTQTWHLDVRYGPDAPTTQTTSADQPVPAPRGLAVSRQEC